MTAASHRPLLARWPALAARTPFIELGTLPTPVNPAPGLAAQVGCGNLLVKRDDLSAVEYGGNKIRKLEFLLADALAQGKTHVITYGGLGSNHARATAIYCRKLGLHCTAILTQEPMTEAVQATLTHHAELGTRIERLDDYHNLGAARDAVAAEYGADACYDIPFGGSSRVGALGFVNAGLELAEQVATGQCPAPECIYLACGTAGTAAGLAVGLELAGLNTHIEAVQVTPDSLQPSRLITRLVDDVIADLSAAGVPVPAATQAINRVHLRNDQLGAGYAQPTEAGRQAAALWNQATGLPVSLTYTAKALAGLIADGRNGALEQRTVMFWNTYNSRPV